MKNLKLIDKIIYLINGLLAFVLLLSYLLPFVPPKTFALLSVLSLGVPFLILINVIFFLYWLIKLKKQLILSLVVLIIGYFSFGSLYKFSSEDDEIHDYQLKVMNYNVRLFNLYDWIPEKGIAMKMVDLINDKAPDVLTIQEYHPHPDVNLSSFKYKFEKLSGNKTKYGQVILSQYPIINSGSVEFPETSNNAIFADIVKADDTIRIYNIHLQSLKIDANMDKLQQEDSERLLKRIEQTFEMQQLQTELFLEHKAACPYKVIISGDFNNTAFSYVYKELKGNLKDTFKQAGNGFGRTYDFKFFPIRIDFILSDPSFEITDFKTIDNKYSDHYPIMTTLKLH
ncbi:Metal-dependent hydrolase, endonuclease/exonuclease/phosphatase family [Bizionia echini]|uniref:Metal-dependent hydrolase, endonuclease/exonuclease/phosphatase family n=1 Tax=Bizionia echini TaxID=649333 RepID=A0A1I5BF33_9FLAO|nr:endonuclease/exonuclease/phosphatase family protein [Bizionia echini]SFN73348.1 Metal-dependent hydrolase, endonuclease/exonuclease/phosphatase family [Bizionia echini]